MISLLRSESFSSIEALGRELMSDAGASLWWPQIRAETGQRSRYAPIRYNEYHQPSYVTSLEQKFGIDIQLNRTKPLTPQETAILNRVLNTVRTRRPTDLQLLRILTFERGAERGLGHADNPDRLTFHGAFGRPNSSATMTELYAIDSVQSHMNNSTEDFLLQKFTHELGHLVEHRDGIEWYAQRYEKGRGSEWFAEDYSLFVVSGGQRVMATTATGQTAPDYAERLEYMRSHYALGGTARVGPPAAEPPPTSGEESEPERRPL